MKQYNLYSTPNGGTRIGTVYVTSTGNIASVDFVDRNYQSANKPMVVNPVYVRGLKQISYFYVLNGKP